MEFLINIADYCILVKFYREMLGKPRYQKRITWLGFSFVLVAGMTWLNHMNLPIVNIISSFVYLLAAGLWFESKMKNRILMAVFYWGIFMGADLLVVLLARVLPILELEKEYMILLKIIYVLLMYFAVNIVCALKKEARGELPTGTTCAIAIVFSVCAMGCIVLNKGGIKGKFDYLGIILLLSVFILIHFLTFQILEKLNKVMQINYEQKMLLQEVKWKEIHFKELEEINQKILRMRHDMNNRLRAICELNDLYEMKNSIRLICGEITSQSEKIYTGNQIVNGICKTKFELAEKKNIHLEQKINIPSKLNMESGEIGILLGNILDNAIEACQKTEERYIYFVMEARGSNLLISMENSKPVYEKGGIGRTTKKDRKMHGYGMISVKSIIKKYNGILSTKDMGERYKTEMILYHVI